MLEQMDLRFWADISSVSAFVVAFIGAAVGIWGYARYRCTWRKKRKALEAYLKRQKQNAPPGKKGQHTINHLIRYVGLTEDEILQISFESDAIDRRVDADKDGKASELYFEYVGK